MSLRDSAPIYVTRKTASGETMQYDMSLWMSLVAILLVWVNVMVWGVVGLIVAVRVIA